MPQITTVGEKLYWCYANLAMEHARLNKNAAGYSQVHYMIRSRLFKGLTTGTMSIGQLFDDEKIKLKAENCCSYCRGVDHLSIDHLIPVAKGGQNDAENLVLACRTCNSSKKDNDLLTWYRKKSQNPPLLLFRRYLKLGIIYCQGHNLMEVEIEQIPALPFAIELLPDDFSANWRL